MRMAMMSFGECLGWLSSVKVGTIEIERSGLE